MLIGMPRFIFSFYNVIFICAYFILHILLPFGIAENVLSLCKNTFELDKKTVYYLRVSSYRIGSCGSSPWACHHHHHHHPILLVAAAVDKKLITFFNCHNHFLFIYIICI